MLEQEQTGLDLSLRRYCLVVFSKTLWKEKLTSWTGAGLHDSESCHLAADSRSKRLSFFSCKALSRSCPSHLSYRSSELLSAPSRDTWANLQLIYIYKPVSRSAQLFKAVSTSIDWFSLCGEKVNLKFSYSLPKHSLLRCNRDHKRAYPQYPAYKTEEDNQK